MISAREIWFYAGYVLAWTALITTAGALAGAILFPLVGGLGGAEKTMGELAWIGVKSVGMIAFVWAPGTAIVLAFRREYLRRRGARRQPSETSR